MKAILMSIKPQYVAKILNGDKTIEIRKRFPKDYIGWVYIYVTKDKVLTLCNERCITIKGEKYRIDCPILNGKVVARFWCDKVEEIYANPIGTWEYHNMHIKACLTNQQLCNYLDSNKGCAIYITKLEIFDQPKEISEFKPYYGYPTNHRLTRAPQSWCYIGLCS